MIRLSTHLLELDPVAQDRGQVLARATRGSTIRCRSTSGPDEGQDLADHLRDLAATALSPFDFRSSAARVRDHVARPVRVPDDALHRAHRLLEVGLVAAQPAQAGRRRS